MGHRYETSANEIICRGSVTVAWLDYKGFNPTEDGQDWIKTLTHLEKCKPFYPTIGIGMTSPRTSILPVTVSKNMGRTTAVTMDMGPP
jgi:hypothetical protein